VIAGGKRAAGAPDQKQGLAVMAFASQAEWETWLARNHAKSAGLWIKFAKKGTQTASISYTQALDSALCYGWIDGQRSALDESFWLLRLTRRGPKSIWSQINCKRADELIADGRMKSSGLAQVDAAKSDGRWAAAYAGQRTMLVPADLQALLAAHPRAERLFAQLDSKNRYAILFRVHGAKVPETRARRIAQYVAMLDAGEVIYPSTLPKAGPAAASASAHRVRPK
jgi:uncharacterized protein YdeI (YjbR/CyaY-like superfamily)